MEFLKQNIGTIVAIIAIIPVLYQSRMLRIQAEAMRKQTELMIESIDADTIPNIIVSWQERAEAIITNAGKSTAFSISLVANALNRRFDLVMPLYEEEYGQLKMLYAEQRMHELFNDYTVRLEYNDSKGRRYSRIIGLPPDDFPHNWLHNLPSRQSVFILDLRDQHPDTTGLDK